MKTGIIIGKFAPLTNGHISFINRASNKCDKLLVILSFDERWLEGQSQFMRSKLTYKNRLLWLKHTFKNVDHIVVDSVDESNIPAFPNGWQSFIDMVKDRAKDNLGTDSPDYVFSSEPSYDEGFSTYLPHTEHVVIDAERKEVDISATRIREDVIKYWEFIPSVVRKSFIFKVAVTGKKGVGKTTLVQQLAKNFNTSWANDCTSDYIKNNLQGLEWALDNNDLFNIFIENYKIEQEAIITANRIVFSDTTTVNQERMVEDYQTYFAFNEREEYDLYIVLGEDGDEIIDDLPQDKEIVSIRGNREENFDTAVQEVLVHYRHFYE